MSSFKRITLVMTVAAPFFAPMAAEASVQGSVNQMLDHYASIAHPDAIAPAQPVVLRPATAQVAPANENVFQSEFSDFNIPSLPSLIVAELPNPSVEMPLKKLACVEYARARSGLAVFGDAKFWWARAKNLYARLSTPVENSVMVFAASSKMRLGHVAVVTNIVSGREIRVDQANWLNRGEIDHSTPIVDVSAKNDWSEVRVWDIKSGRYGNVYAVSGFIAKDATLQADAE